MSHSVAHAVSNALPVHAATGADVDLRELQGELDLVAAEALAALDGGCSLGAAVHDPRFPALRQFHRDLRDALFLEIPASLRPWVESLASGGGGQSSGGSAPADALGDVLTSMARRGADGPDEPPNTELQRALAQLLVYESIRLRLLVAAWQSEEFERLGGEESDVDAIAWEEVEALLDDPAIVDASVRPLQVMFAAASVSLARDAADRVGALRRSGEDLREQLGMRARLRAALRELRLPESVLLENALATLLGEERVELHELQEQRRVALEGLSRQAMDQRVSRGRRALTRSTHDWPKRRHPALFDLLRHAG
jgi:hypothetical protein